MNKRRMIYLAMMATSIVALVPAILAQTAPQTLSPLPTPVITGTLPPWCEDVSGQQPCLPWRPTPGTLVIPTQTPDAPPAATLPGPHLYLPLITR